MPATYIDQIRRTTEGETEAFSAVVREFQDMAYAVALGWVGNSDAAKDIAQDALLDAYEHLHELQKPEAFPGWFKRIVVKHCDRTTRRKPIRPDAQSRATEDPATTMEQSQSRQLARFLVEALPPKERALIALQYFAELSGPEIADLMDLSLPTVKKRLRTARNRLRTQGDYPMNKQKIVAPKELGDQVMFFVALRNRDYVFLKSLLSKSPALANATQSWDPSLTDQQLLPYPNQATALIVAIELNDLKLLQLLLAAGADPDGVCGCATAETPLWAAALFNRATLAERLLAAGANPNLASSSGNYPIHLAAMRGSTDVVAVLLNHGAKSNLLDRGPVWPRTATGNGRNALQWAEANGHKVVAQLIRAKAKPVPAALDVPTVTMSIQDTVLHTGIKAVDLLAPIPFGALTQIPLTPNSGVVTFLGELSRRWLDAGLGRVLWTGFAAEPVDRHDWAADLAEIGLENRVDLNMGSLRQESDERIQVYDDALASAERQEGATLVVVVSNPGFEHCIESSYPRLAASDKLTCMVLVPPSQAIQEPLAAPFAARIQFDPLLTTKRLLPPVDSRLSDSTVLKRLHGDRLRLAELTRLRIAEYIDSDPNLDDVFATEPQAQGAAASALLRYLSQPFFVTEPFTGNQGEFVPLDKLLDDVAAIIGR